MGVLAGSLLHPQRGENASRKYAGRKFKGLAPRRGLRQDPSKVVK
jgi:hypothetical protein